MYNGQCITGCHKRILIAQYFIRFMLKGAMTGVTSTSSFMPRTAAVPREACEINLTNHPNFSVGSSLLFIRSVYVINLNLKSFLLAQLQIIYCKNIHGNILKWHFLFHASISIKISLENNPTKPVSYQCKYNWWEYIHKFILSYLTYNFLFIQNIFDSEMRVVVSILGCYFQRKRWS